MDERPSPATETKRACVVQLSRVSSPNQPASPLHLHPNKVAELDAEPTTSTFGNLMHPNTTDIGASHRLFAINLIKIRQLAKASKHLSDSIFCSHPLGFIPIQAGNSYSLDTSNVAVVLNVAFTNLSASDDSNGYCFAKSPFLLC